MSRTRSFKDPVASYFQSDGREIGPERPLTDSPMEPRNPVIFVASASIPFREASQGNSSSSASSKVPETSSKRGECPSRTRATRPESVELPMFPESWLTPTRFPS